MTSDKVAATIAKFLFIGTPFVSVFLLIDVGTDPVNVTKLFALGGLGTGILGIFVAFNLKKGFKPSKLVVLVSISFLAGMFNRAPLH
jgi:hypothetical protein